MPNTLLLMLAFFAAFLMVAELFRRYRLVGLTFFVLSLPALLVPNANLFMRIKTISVLLPMCFLAYARYKPRIEGFIYKLIYLVIVLNIIEASVIDWQTGNILNIVAAVGLIVCLPYSRKHWEVSGRHSDFVVHVPAYWPYLYTTWNLCFLYSARITTFGYALPLLLAPVAYALLLRRSDLYFQARAYTFGFYLFVRTLAGDTPLMNLPAFDLTGWYSPDAALAWSVVNVIFTGACLYSYGASRNKNKAIEQGV